MDLLRDELSRKPAARRYREADAILSERGIVAAPLTVGRLARAIVRARLSAEEVGLSRARGDWSPETHGARFPLPSQRPAATSVIAPPTAKLTTDKLLAKFAAENPQNDKTMAKRNAALRQLETSAGHNDAVRIAKADVRAMKERRQGGGRQRAGTAFILRPRLSLRPGNASRRRLRSRWAHRRSLRAKPHG